MAGNTTTVNPNQLSVIGDQNINWGNVPKFTLTPQGNVPQNLQLPGGKVSTQQLQSSFAQMGRQPSFSSSLPIGGTDSGTPQAISQAKQYFGSQFNAPTMPPTTEGNGKDTEFGYLTRVGKDMNPMQRDRYNQLIREWQAAHPAPPPPPQPAPPPVPTPQAMGQPQSIGGAAPTGQVSSPKGGAQGQASPIDTFMTKIGQGLQGVKSLGQQVGSQLNPDNLEKASLVAGMAGAPLALETMGASELPAAGLFGAAKLARFAPKLEEALQTGGSLAREAGSLVSKFPSDFVSRLPQNLARGIGIGTAGVLTSPKWMPGSGGVDQALGQFNQWLRQFQTTKTTQPIGGGDGGSTQIQRETNTQKQSLTPTPITPKQATELVTAHLTDPTNNPRSSVAAALASDSGIKTINKQIDQAQKAGDFNAVSSLVDLARDAQSNMVMQQQIQAIINTIAQGFGTPNMPGVTQERQPMVQQGVFQGLEAPQVPQAPQFSQTPGQETSMLPFRLPEVTQRNQVPTFPFNQPVNNAPFAPGGRLQQPLPSYQA